MKKLKINFWLQRHRKLLVFVMSFVALYMTIVGMTKMDFCTLTENAGLFGVVGTLLGAFIGGVFSLMGSVWVVGKLSEEALNSKFIKNNQGILTEKAIDYKQDIKPVVQALAAYIKDDTLGIVHRIAFLRKYYEHNGIENYKEAYDVLSSLIHGRDKCKYVNNSEMPQAEIQKGCTEIKKWIQNFDYDELYRNVYNEEKLAELYFAETNDYLKIQLFRALFEVNPSREIKEEDVLVKFINESYHIENDYAYYLDMVKFETVPEYIVKAIDDYMERTYSNV